MKSDRQMKNRVIVSRTGKLLLFTDVIVISASLFTAWIIRAQFQGFIYDIRRFSVLFPWVLFLRLLINFIFESYSFTFNSFTNVDITKLFKHNIVATAVLLFLRFFSPISNLRMPLTIIFLEYIFTSFGFFVMRLIIHMIELRDNINSVGYIARVLLWGEVKDIRDTVDIKKLEEKNFIEVKGILNNNSFHWNTEYKKIRVFGNEDQLSMILANDNRISMICFVTFDFVTKSTLTKISEKAKKIRLEIGFIENNTIKTIYPDRILDYYNRNNERQYYF